MATLTADRAKSTFPVYKSGGAGALCSAWGKYTLAANPTAADIIEFVRLPAGAVVVGGYLRGEDIDTGTETLDIDIGWAANGVEAADPDGFGNFGVITGDAVTEWKPEVSIFLPLNGVLKSGPVSFTNETIVQGVVNAAAQAGGTGVLWLRVDYLTP
jgi:hypothetical protein